jgi:Tfp pilus assembly protein PilF
MFRDQSAVAEPAQHGDAKTPAVRSATQPELIDDFEDAINEHRGWTLTQIEDALKKEPNSSLLLTDLARAYMLDGDVDEAISILNKVVARDPQCGRAHLLRGQIYWSDRRADLAIAETKKAISSGPPIVTTTASYGLGIMYRDQKRYKESRSEFTKVIGSGMLTTKCKALVEYQRADLALRSGDQEQFLTEISVVLKEDPNMTPAIIARAHLFSQQKNKVKEAISDYTKAINLEENQNRRVFSQYLGTCYRERANLWIRVGREDLARKDRVLSNQYDRDSMPSK